LKKKIFYDDIVGKRDLKEMIEDVSSTYPERPAFLRKVNRKYEEISFSQYMHDINALGTAFIDMGLKDAKIGVIGENRYEWCVTYLAVANGTGVVVPLDKELNSTELTFLAKEAGIKAIVYSGKQQNKITELKKACPELEYILSMDSEDKGSYADAIIHGKKLIDEGNREYIDAKVDPDELRMLLFTSGTTGISKGVMLCHRNIISNVYGMKKIIRVGPEDRTLSILPIHHAFECTTGFLTAISSGASVAFCEGLKYIAENIREAKPTILVSVPLIIENVHRKIIKKAEATFFKKLAFRVILGFSSILSQSSRKKLFKTVHDSLGGKLHHIISGASALSPEVSRTLDKMGVPILQGYGLTECAPVAAGNPERFYKHGALGLPLPGVEMKINEPDKDGIGEILVKGDNVMLGYYQNPEETAKTIKSDWLHTGDYGRTDRHGFYIMTGRKKNMIVTKTGKNIFPEELEEYLNNSPFILESVVSDSESDVTKDNHIQAHIVPNFENIKDAVADTLPDMDEIKRIIGEEIKKINKKLPSFKRIRIFHIRDKEFEKTTTRKIKRHRNKD